MNKIKKIYDVVVIGAGSAGFSSAETARSQGASVLVIEKDVLGGECPNWACVPTKALLKSAKSYWHAKHNLKDLGIEAKSVTFSFTRIMGRKDAVVEAITGGGTKVARIAEKLGIDVLKGNAKFIDSHTIDVDGKKIKAKSVIIATGTTTFVPPIAGLKEVGYLDFKDVVSLKRKPDSIVIIGGGPVACEFATFFAMLETKVTLIQLMDKVLNREDVDISNIAQKSLEIIGVNVLVNTKTLSIEKIGKKKVVTFQSGEDERATITVDDVVIATGKRANVDNLMLDKAGVKLDKRGRMVVSDALQTNIKHIFGAGDVTGGMQFTHTAHAEGYIAGINALKKSSRSFLKRDERVVPRVTFVEPEVASVGITEQEAVAKKIKVQVLSFPVGALGRAVTEGDRVGLIKIVVDKKTGEILGGHMIGARAGEVIHEIALAMQSRIKAVVLRDMIHAFPTFSEAIPAVLSSLE